MLGGEFELITLLGKSGQLEMVAEAIGSPLDGLPPAIDTTGERPIDVLKCLLGEGVAGLAQAVENASRLDLLFGLVAQESIV